MICPETPTDLAVTASLTAAAFLSAPHAAYTEAFIVNALRRSGALNYQRFGFRCEPQLVYPGIPPAFFMVLPFTDALPSGTVTFHPAFGATV
jgi:predicted N-acetyltransferase YhbS